MALSKNRPTAKVSVALRLRPELENSDRFYGTFFPAMKIFRTFLLRLCLLALIVPTCLRADAVDDLKTDITTNLPPNSHADRVRQFLKVRKFKFTEQKKERKISAECALPASAGVARPVAVIFIFDENELLVDVAFPPASRSATHGQARLRSSQEPPIFGRPATERL
jgi:hypothetical protein